MEYRQSFVFWWWFIIQGNQNWRRFLMRNNLWCWKQWLVGVWLINITDWEMCPVSCRDGTFHGACWKWTLCPTDGNFTQLNSSSNISEQNTSAFTTLQYWSSPQSFHCYFILSPGESLDPKTRPCATADETLIWIWKTKCFVPEAKRKLLLNMISTW